MSAEKVLMAAVQRGNVAGVAAALDAAPGDKAWAKGMNDAVHVACLHGRLDCLRLLLAAGADPNTKSYHGAVGDWHLRPIHKAAQAGHPACVAALLEAGVDPCAKTTISGCTPLDAAIEAASGDSAQLLLAEADLQPANEITDRLIRTLVRFDENGEHDRLRRLAPAVPVFLARTGLSLDAGDDNYTFARYRSHMVSSALARWLPAMLRCSDAAAAQLVPFLPPPDRERLRTLALCLVRYQQRSLSARLPAPIAGRLLALAEAQHAQHSRHALVNAVRHAKFPKVLALHVFFVLLAVGVMCLMRTGWPSKP